MIGSMSIIGTIMNLNNGIDIKVNELVGKCPGRNYRSEDFKNLSKSDTFFFCTIQEAKQLQDRQHGCVSYGKYEYCVSTWMPAIGSNALNWKGSYYLHSAQLSEREIGMFCRSNAGDKQWAGQVIRDASDIALIKDRTLRDQFMFVAPVMPIECEWRCWMVDGKCVEAVRYVNPFCEYTVTEKEPDINDARRYAEWLDDELHQPDDMYVVDIARSAGELKVVEYNSFSTSGWHDADPEKLIAAVERHFSSQA